MPYTQTGPQGPQAPEGQQQQQSFFRSQYDRQRRQQAQVRPVQDTQDRSPQMSGPPRSTSFSPVSSDGRIAPPSQAATVQQGAPAPQQPVQQPQQQAVQQQNAGAQPFNAPLQFDQNKWQAGPKQGSQDYNFWQWAIGEQTGNKDFWGTLKEGTVMSGSPNRVWVKSPNGDWGSMDKGEYLNMQSGGLGNLPPGALYRAGDLGNEKFVTYNPAQFDQSGLPTYGAAQFNVQAPGAYNQYQFDQFQAPNQQVLDQMQEQRLRQMMQSPYTMSDTNVAQMREMQKEQVARGLRDQQQQLEQRMAAMGRLGSGYQNAVSMRAQEQGQNQLISGARDIALRKMQQDRADEMQAIEAASKFQAGQMGRASESFKNVLAGQTAQAGEGRYAQDDAWRRGEFDLTQQQANAAQQLQAYQSQADARKFLADIQQRQADEGFRGFESQKSSQAAALQRALDQQNLNLQQAKTAGDLWTGAQTRALQEKLGLSDIDVRNRQLGMQGQQFSEEMKEKIRQFNASLGFNYNQLNANQQQSFAQLLAQTMGQR